MAIVDCDSERIWKIVESYRVNVPKRRRLSDSSPSLFDRLYDCYVDCSQTGSDKSADKRFRNAVNLLERLSPSHAHPSLIVNLYPDEQGYSLVLSPKKENETEELFLPYEDNEIFSYLDNQELPPVLVEVLGQTKHCHMYNGCVVCEVRDHRSLSRSPGNYDRHLLLLRPTTETILSTVEEMAFESGCSAEDKLMLESRLLLATQPPICLDPSTDVVCFTNRLQYNQRKFHTHAIRRTLRKRSHARRARMHMTSEGVAPRGLQLHDFITERAKATPREKNRDFSNCWKKAKIDHRLEDTPETIFASVLQFAKPVTPPLLIESHPQPRRPSAASQLKPHPQPHPQQPTRPPTAIHPPLDEREAQSTVVSGVQNEVAHLERHHPPHSSVPHPSVPHPPHPSMPLPPQPSMPHPPHPSVPHPPRPSVPHPPHPHVPMSIPDHVQQPTIDHAHPYHPSPRPPPPSHPPPPVISPPPTSTSITPSLPSQPHPLTPTHPPAPLPVTAIAPVHVQPMVPASANMPMSATPTPAQATPPTLQAPPPAPPPHSMHQQQPMINYGPIQLPPGVTHSPEILKLFLAQYQAQAAVKKPRLLAPAVTKTTTVVGGAPADKSKLPALVGKPPPLSQGGSNAVVVVPRSGGSTQVHVSSQVRPPLNLLSAPPPPPSLTPSPKKRPLLSHPTQNVSPGQGGMPKLHPLTHELSSQKTSLPPQPSLSKPIAPPPPLSSSATGAPPPPLTMPTLHKITAGAATLPTQQKQPPPQLHHHHHHHQQKATPIVGGGTHAPPLKPNPNVTMPKLTSSAGQVRPIVSGYGLPVLSRAPVPLHPAPPPKPHPQKVVSSSSVSSNLSVSSSSSSGIKLTLSTRPVPASKTSTGSKSHKKGASSGKSHGSKKKKK